jgi:cell division septum initiation protein DivIVA
VALDRQSIEKRDFPVGRQGYDPAAVDAHLSSLADEVAELKRTARRRSDTLASSASDQVRAIVEAAETSAADIQRDAESDAKEIRDEANYEAQATKELATEQARDYVGKVSESTDTMLKRLDSMQGELDTLVESLRNGSGRLSSDLKLLESNLTEVRGVVVPRPEFEPEESAAPAAAASEPGAEAEEAPPAESETGEDAAESDTSDESETAETGSSASSGNGDGAAEDDAEGARLIALNMALNGTPREETAKYLDENFSLTDAGGLLDEVYASVEG